MNAVAPGATITPINASWSDSAYGFQEQLVVVEAGLSQAPVSHYLKRNFMHLRGPRAGPTLIGIKSAKQLLGSGVPLRDVAGNLGASVPTLLSRAE